MLADRCLLRRFAAAFLAVLALLAAFYALLLVRTGVSSSAEGQTWASVVRELLVGLLRSADVLLAVAAPTAILHVLLGLRRRGILVTLAAGGLAPSRLRRGILGLALTMAALAVGAAEVASRASASAPGDARVWRSGGHWAWLVPGPAGAGHEDLVVFESSDLGVWRATDVRRPLGGAPIEFGGAAPVHGAAPAPTTISGARPLRPPFRTLPPSRWNDASVDLEMLIAFFLQVLVGPLLLVLSANLALVMRRAHLSMAWVAFLLLLPAVAACTITVVVVLRHSAAWGTAAAIAWLLTAAATFVALDRRFSRRGLRL